MRRSARSTTFSAVLALAAALVAPVRLLASTPTSRDTTTVLDSARAEMAVGRNWHAAALLAPLHEEGVLDRAGLLLLARAEAGYRHWKGVRAVLEGVAATSDLDGPTWQLLGRAREAVDAPGAAAEAYGRALAGGLPPAQAQVARLRLARVQWSADRRTEALAVLDSVEAPAARSWLALELLSPAVEDGDTAVVRTLLSRITVPAPQDLAWDATARARWEAGDSVGAAQAYRTVLESSPTYARKAPAWRVVGEVALAGGDSAAARSAFEKALDASPYGRSGGTAARHLVDLGGLTASLALTAARSLDRLGDGNRALKAYDRYVVLSEAAGEEPAPSARVERARIMATVRDRQEEAISEYRALSTSPDPEVGSRALVLWAGLRRRQGRTGDEATIRRWLVERYPNTAAAADVVFFRGDAAHDRQNLTTALEDYGRVAEMAPALDRAGLARMRMGMILLETGRVEEAADVYEGYLAAFPSGRRWEEATYWAARTRLALGDSARGVTLLKRLQDEEPFSYYAMLTADLLDRPFVIEGLPAGPEPVDPEWLQPALDELDLLRAAGLDAGASNAADAIVARARREGHAVLTTVAERLIDRGRTMEGINLGWELRREGEPWSLRLLRVVYPFPYREMVTREAREWGVDPYLLAALIRQESAWVPDIVSAAGAVGLMQVMPATGKDLARSIGPDDFTTESLETPEVNLHLGARFLVDVIQRYGPDMPLILSAYNAGPTRAERWKGFPEAVDPLRLTERIPFAETRGYVKNVTRNARLYQALYQVDERVAR